MKNLTDIKYRIKSISDTKQITGAMETISVAKMRKAMARYDSNKAFFEKIRSSISDIVLHTNCVTSRYLSKAKGERAVFIVVASDKGLAGGFNHNVLTAAWEKIQTVKQCSVFTIGQLAREFFERKGLKPDVEFTDAAYEPTMHDAIEIAEAITQLYDRDMMDEVYIVYTKMVNSVTMHPDCIRLLPLSADEIVDADRPLTVDEEYYLQELEYEPSPDEVLASLIPQYLTGILYGALVQSTASEHSSRRAAMSNATKNATELLEGLHIEYNRARQESVTSELTEIIASSLGVSK